MFKSSAEGEIKRKIKFVNRVIRICERIEMGRPSPYYFFLVVTPLLNLSLGLIILPFTYQILLSILLLSVLIVLSINLAWLLFDQPKTWVGLLEKRLLEYRSNIAFTDRYNGMGIDEFIINGRVNTIEIKSWAFDEKMHLHNFLARYVDEKTR